MIRTTFLRYDVLRTFRNWQLVLFTLALPVILYFAIAGSQRHGQLYGVAYPVSFMSSMATFGTIGAAIASSATIAAERSTGWTRQMRITPLPTSSYFSAKLVAAYLRAILTIAVMGVSGLSLGAHLSVGGWLTMIGLLLVGLIPFAVLGILLGQILDAAAITPAGGGITMILLLLGGALGFQLASSGPVLQVIKALPSFWLVQAGKAAVVGRDWPAEGWIVLAAWTAVLVPLTMLAYRRSTSHA